jgi:type VI secretion system protein ImpM
VQSRRPEETAPGPETETPTGAETEGKTDTAPDTVAAAEETQAAPETLDGAAPDPEDAAPETAAETEAVTEGAEPEAEHAPEPEAAPGPAAWTTPAPEATGPCEAGLFGKLPARGDFISRAIAQDLLRPLEDWLLPLVQATRELLGAGWEAAWRQAPPWRFWIGPDILRGDWTRSLRAHEQAGTVTGVLLPSVDRQGRLFPLVLVLGDEHARLMPPPVLAAPDRGFYAACDALLLAARAGRALEAVEADLAALNAPRLPEGAAQMAGLLARRALWGQGGDADGGDGSVWSGIRASDHHLAATGRSYWWCEGAGGTTSVISLAGLPDADTFAFMLTDAIPPAEPQTGA